MRLQTILLILSLAWGTGLMAQSTDKALKRANLQAPSETTDDLTSVGYTLTVSNGNYNDLFGVTTSVNNGQIWDDPEYKVPIGFPFLLYGKEIDTLYFGTALGGTVGDTLLPNFESEYVILFFETDLLDRGELSGGSSLSPISYQLEGSPGKRTFKLEMKNAGFFDELDQSGTMDDFVNVQLWLYEGSNEIEVRIGPNQVTDPNVNYFGDPGPYIGVTDFAGNNAFLLSGDASSPTLASQLGPVNGTPPNGIIYKFVPTGAASISDREVIPVKVFPNPAQEQVRIEWDATNLLRGELTLSNALGQTVFQEEVSNGVHSLDLSQLEKGIYYLMIQGENKIMRQQIVRQ